MRRVRVTGQLPYRPPLAGAPEERVSAFVGLARTMRRHGRGCDFDARRWDVTDTVARRAGVPAKPGRHAVIFEPDDVEAVGAGAEVAPFVRAYVGMLPAVGHAKLSACAAAGALLARALNALGAKTIADVTVAVLNEAAALARRSGASGSVANARAVREIGGFLAAHGMTRAPLAGVLPSPPVAPLPARCEEGHAARSGRLLPSDCFLDALSEAHRLASDPADVIVTRVALVLMSAPSRINEALAIEEEVEVEREVGGVAVLGLRWRGSKDAEDCVKWVAPPMAAAVREACDDLRQVTAEGRKMKAWYADHPTSLYLPPALAHLRGRDSLTIEECGVLLGRRLGSGLRRQMAALSGTLTEGGECVVSFSDVEAYLLSMLPDRMADAGGPSCRPLLVVPWGTFDGRRRPPCPCMFETVKYRHIADALGGPLFSRHGLDAVGGRTHSFRHWLVTEALRGGLSMADVAAWCGKTRRASNRTYDHRTADEMRALLRRASAASRRPGSPFARVGFAGPIASATCDVSR